MADNTYVFRLQDENERHDLSNSLKHWDVSQMYNEKQIAAIKSSNSKSEHQPTSIPSPFARIALVKTAFTEVAKYGENALMAYQKIVSDTLDVAEIFFTIDKWSKIIEIIKWDKEEQLENLKRGHSQLYKTFKTYLENDAYEFNFDKLKCIYILKYKPTGEMIGATSPSTVFFSSGNDLTNIDIQLSSEHKAFHGIKPLSERSWEFQKYLHLWSYANKDLRQSEWQAPTFLFQEFYHYLENQKEKSGKFQEIDELQKNAFEELNKSFSPLRAPDVEVLGKPIYKCKDALFINDFLTENDIFEENIIQVPFKIQSKSYFDGNIQDNSDVSYLLPLKDKIFKLFSIDIIKSSLKITHVNHVVEVTFDLENKPYKKKYTETKGEIIKPSFDCALFPNIKFTKDTLAHYRFGIVCDFKEKDKFSAEYIKINDQIDTNNIRVSLRNETYDKSYVLKNYSLQKSNFDYIRFTYKGFSGVIIPHLKPMSENKKYKFAVDFGTTNTHLEYSIIDDNKQNIVKSEPFDIKETPEDEKQVHWLHGGESLLIRVFDEEYIPPYTNDEFKFPMRTALSYGQGTNWSDVYPFEKASLNELYEKRKDFPYNQTITNIKWSDDLNYRNQVKVYIESLMYIMRNKVIIGDGKLEDTQIIWFYPVSMERGRLDNLKKVWKEAYKKYFGENENNIVSVPESVAPFLYYVGDRNANNLVTIDIGGGTTDILIAVNDQIDCITSFRFAANTIFGDGYSDNNRLKNGIVRQFKDQIRNELLTGKNINEENELIENYDLIYNTACSADIASFLFSLKYNKTVRKAGENLAENVNLNKKLVEDQNQKITFMLFYSAIIYHLAKLMKAKELKMPEKIVFSGNGSRVIEFFTDNSTLLKNYTKQIFEKIYGVEEYSKDLEIIINKDNPKEATCKGGFFNESLEKNYEENIRNKQVVLHSNKTNSLILRNLGEIKETDKYEFIYNNEEEYLTKTTEEAKEFFEFVFNLLPLFEIEGYRFKSESVEIARKECFKRLDIHTKNGWRIKKEKEKVEKSWIIEESFFFYPLVGAIKDLVDAICDKVTNNN
ncbi:MAG TPA: hypothetical protein PLK32_06895 [Defluviitoga tunisiensis]|nr:hypothetical protein [Defluviitoga tunisiensis]